MRYSVYDRRNVTKPLMVCYGYEAFCKFLAWYQLDLKGLRFNYETLREELIYNNVILDSVYLGSGDGLYAILNEYGSFVDARNYYGEILKYRKYYRYPAWSYGHRGVLEEKEPKLNFVYRRGPVPDISCRRSWNPYRKLKFKHLVQEVGHEDYQMYNRPKRKEVRRIGGVWYDDFAFKSNHKDRCWKQQKIKRQYMKHLSD